MLWLPVSYGRSETIMVTETSGGGRLSYERIILPMRLLTASRRVLLLLMARNASIFAQLVEKSVREEQGDGA